MIKANLSVKVKKPPVTIYHIESNAGMKLPQTDRAQGKWPVVALLEMVGAIHEAVEIYAVPQ